MKLNKIWVITTIAVALLSLVSCQTDKSQSVEHTSKEMETASEDVEFLVKDSVDMDSDPRYRERIEESYQKLLADENVSSDVLYSVFMEYQGLWNEAEKDVKMEDLFLRCQRDKKILDTILEREEVQSVLGIMGEGESISQNQVQNLVEEPMKSELMAHYPPTLNIVNLGGYYGAAISFKSLAMVKGLGHRWQDYFALRIAEQDQPYAAEGELRISFEELAKRLADWEKYIYNYGFSEQADELKEEFPLMLGALMRGLDHSSVAGEDGRLLEEVRKVYETYAYQEQTILGQTLSRYLEVLKVKDFVVDEDVLAGADRLIENATNLMKNSK